MGLAPLILSKQQEISTSSKTPLSRSNKGQNQSGRTPEVVLGEYNKALIFYIKNPISTKETTKQLRILSAHSHGNLTEVHMKLNH